MRLLITGSRNHPEEAFVHAAIVRVAPPESGPHTIVHGDCPTGADSYAQILATNMPGYVNEPHPADWDRHGKAAGPIRNQEMVDLGADVCLAFPFGVSRGTRDCARRAEHACIPVLWQEEEAGQ